MLFRYHQPDPCEEKDWYTKDGRGDIGGKTEREAKEQGGFRS